MERTILVIDDSAVIRAAVGHTLKGVGYCIAEARDGREALNVLKDLTAEGRRPALIVVDVNMPIMDGITFIKQAKQSDAKFIPILVLTTEAEKKMIEAGKEAGAAGWLVKPFKEEMLVSVVRKFVR
jgi:two-component system chemotaxis response regulator CheY